MQSIGPVPPILLLPKSAVKNCLCALCVMADTLSKEVLPGSFAFVGLTCPVKRSIMDCDFGSIPSAIVVGSLFWGGVVCDGDFFAIRQPYE